MRHSIIAIVIALASTAFAQTDLEVRVAQLEQQVAELQTLFSTPPPPPTTVTTDGFTFARVDARQTGIGIELVGEVTSEAAHERVTFRVTYYATDGSILETDTFSVESVGATPRTFGTGMFTDVALDDVHSIGLQVERLR